MLDFIRRILVSGTVYSSWTKPLVFGAGTRLTGLALEWQHDEEVYDE